MTQSFRNVRLETTFERERMMDEPHQTQPSRMRRKDLRHGAQRQSIDQHELAVRERGEDGGGPGERFASWEWKAGIQAADCDPPTERLQSFEEAAIIMITAGRLGQAPGHDEL
jgi:hypothetical protein